MESPRGSGSVSMSAARPPWVSGSLCDKGNLSRLYCVASNEGLEELPVNFFGADPWPGGLPRVTAPFSLLAFFVPWNPSFDDMIGFFLALCSYWLWGQEMIRDDFWMTSREGEARYKQVLTSTKDWSFRRVNVSNSSRGTSISSPSPLFSGGIASWIMSTTCCILLAGSWCIFDINDFFSWNVRGFWAASLSSKNQHLAKS